MELGEELVVSTLLRKRAVELGNAPYFTFQDTVYSYAETNYRAQRVAGGLKQLGVDRGDRVGIMSQNCPEMLFTWLGITLLGGIAVPINPAMKGRFLQNILNITGMEVMFVQDSALENMLSLGDDLGRLKSIGIIGNTARAGEHAGRARFVAYDDMLNSDPLDEVVESTNSDPVQILPTSGTTGVSKGVLMPNAHLTKLALTWIYAVGLEHDDRIFMPMQMYHSNGIYAMIASMMVGCTVQMEERFSATRFWQGCRESNATVAHASISLYNIFMQQPPSPDDKNHKVKAFWQTGTNREFERRFGVGAAAGYGTTEIGMVVIGRYDDSERPEGSAGKPYDRFYEVQVVDENDYPVPFGTVGEVVMRPRNPFAMMLGYFGNPEATVSTWRNLWHHTGDLAYFDANGYLYFRSRKKDVIRRRGENISALDVENVLLTHPDVAECAALAYPSEISDDEVRVVMVLRPGATVTAPELCEYCVANLPAYMVPRYFEFRDSLPRTFHNRLEKYRLAEEGLGPNTWDRDH